MTEKEQEFYDAGVRAYTHFALIDALRRFVPVTDNDNLLHKIGVLISERQDAISALRELCYAYGDNEWDDNLHLSDIIEKHLGRYLEYL